MSTGYRLAYRLGLTPWEQAGVGFGPQLASLLDREEAGSDATLGKALDIGCGTGDHAIELARRGWQVTGIDAVDKALEKARAKAPSGAEVRFSKGDATRLEDSVGDGYRLLLDVGCFHGFKAAQREQYARGATAPFCGWKLSDDEAADTTGMPAPLKSSAPRWYRLVRVA